VLVRQRAWWPQFGLPLDLHIRVERRIPDGHRRRSRRAITGCKVGATGTPKRFARSCGVGRSAVAGGHARARRGREGTR
jgi:hypothetical protein